MAKTEEAVEDEAYKAVKNSDCDEIAEESEDVNDVDDMKLEDEFTSRKVIGAASVRPLTLAAWNVRAPSGNPRSSRPQRRQALVAQELARYNVDIAALSETHFPEQDQLEEVDAKYIFSWSGRSKSERRDNCVAFAIQTDVVGRLLCLPQGINDRLMSLRLPLRGGKSATIVSVYVLPR
ncbi:hypothetical protein SprV_0200809700 [Sparganum proliferum]